MNKQGNWWLHALGHYDHLGELLLMHRVTGEVSLSRPTPKVCAWWWGGGRRRAGHALVPWQWLCLGRACP
jgi:hypothetical protein